MGNYNCQECVSKEVNKINELLLNSNILSHEEPPIEETKTYESKIKPKKMIRQIPSQEDIKKIMESKDLSEEQKKFVEKIIKKNSLELYLKNNDKQEEQNKIIERQKQQIKAQQKLIEEYKQKQKLLEQNQQNIKSKKNDTSDNIPNVKITTLEPLKYNTQEKIEIDNVNNDEIIIENCPKSEREINDNKNENPQDEDEKIVIKNDENEDTKRSKAFKIETYEPVIENNDNMDYLFEKNDKDTEPKDSMCDDFRKPILRKTENDNNNYINDIYGPRDSQRKKKNKNKIIDDNAKAKIPLNKGEINKNQKYLSPINNTLQIKPIENNNVINDKININYGNERNALTIGPYLNEVEEIKNAYTAGNIINVNQSDSIINQQISQKDMEMTISDKDTPLILGDNQGNMNYLEKQYEAYKNRMRFGYDD